MEFTALNYRDAGGHRRKFDVTPDILSRDVEGLSITHSEECDVQLGGWAYCKIVYLSRIDNDGPINVRHRCQWDNPMKGVEIFRNYYIEKVYSHVAYPWETQEIYGGRKLVGMGAAVSFSKSQIFRIVRGSPLEREAIMVRDSPRYIVPRDCNVATARLPQVGDLEAIGFEPVNDWTDSVVGRIRDHERFQRRAPELAFGLAYADRPAMFHHEG